MLWAEAEAAIRAEIEAQWAVGAFAAMPLVWENEVAAAAGQYMAVDIEGVASEKSIFGSPGKRSSVQMGIIFFHAFVMAGKGKATALNAVQAMTSILELRAMGPNAEIRLEGGATPSPAEARRDRDWELTNRGQPGGMYFRCSGSVGFVLIGTV